MKKEKLEREIRFRPAYDKRDPDPKKNYGIHGVDMTWYLKGSAGTVQFVVFTNWQLPHVTEETVMRTLKEAQNGAEMAEYSTMGRMLDKCSLHCSFHPLPADVGYHSKVPMYKDQKQMRDNCEAVLGGGPCYYDGSGLAAEEMFKLLVEKGDEAVWASMEERYYETWPEVAP